jgi:hypothetical protein
MINVNAPISAVASEIKESSTLFSEIMGVDNY